MRLVVAERALLAERTLRITLGDPHGATLPSFAPGAHLTLRFAGFERRYSPTSSPRDPSAYAIHVLRAEPGRGGSAHLHDALAVGDAIEADGPHDAFPLELGASHSVLIAGGIGITPFLSMAEALAREGRSFELHHASRSPGRAWPLPLAAEAAARRHVGPGALDVEALLSRLDPTSTLYACGPRRLVEAVRGGAAARGWPPARVRFESFGAAARPGDAPVRVRLARSGAVIEARPGATLLDAIEAAGVWAPSECRRGTCASCAAEVLAGEPDHRDLCLAPAQRARLMCPCVSWARGPEITLDL